VASLAAIVLAGGKGSRLGGADKPGISIGGRTLVSRVVGAALAAGASRVVIVGPARPALTAEFPRAVIAVTRERPPGSGPVPALRAGLRMAGEPWLLLLAADLPFLRERHMTALAIAARPTGGAVLTDDHGIPQWLCGCWRAADLRAAIAGRHGGSLRGLLEPLRPARVAITAMTSEPPPWLDCDSPDDLTAAMEWAAISRKT
jgi:molybdopterin-guanine dinucleotide biosynthesis protein A